MKGELECFYSDYGAKNNERKEEFLNNFVKLILKRKAMHNYIRNNNDFARKYYRTMKEQKSVCWAYGLAAEWNELPIYLKKRFKKLLERYLIRDS